eukprot:TRINITY_DN17534_c0_g1_i1.p1 TRINITY_DN17534_c0_g1~~TRINITY_DN17534_c0_g1_i1.p1  ORF type:complete len:322 (-),score=28.40 TRINITY_DN17534_c0_g1_i1:99-1064(-)
MASLHVEWDHLSHPRFLAITATVGLLEDAIAHPLWVIKTRLQMQRSKGITGIREMARTIIGREGLRTGLYRGYWFGALSAVGTGPLYLETYQWLKHAVSGDPSHSDLMRCLGPLIAGVGADVLSCVTFVPQDVVTQRMQVVQADPEQRKARNVIRHIYRTEGLRGFYTGAVATAISFGIGSGIWWWVYEHSKVQLESHHWLTAGLAAHGPQVSNNAVAAASGALAAFSSTVCLNPVDVIKTRLQTQKGLLANGANVKPYAGIMDAVRHIHRDEGWRGFTRGVKPALVLRVPLHALSTIIYENILRYSWVETPGKTDGLVLN